MSFLRKSTDSLHFRFAVLLACVFSGFAHAANTKLTSPSVALSSPIAGATTTYTFKAKLRNRSGADIAVGNTVTLTFPSGTDLTNLGAVTFQGTLVSAANITKTLSTVTFSAPGSVNKGTQFTIVLDGVKNLTTPGSYAASITTGNSSGGINTGNNIFLYTIVTGAPVKLAITVQPTNTAAGATIFPAVRVAIQDTIGNTVTTATNAITIAIGTNAGGGTLSGTKTLTATNGVAIFNNLSINASGNGYTLVSTSPSLTGVKQRPKNTKRWHYKRPAQPRSVLARVCRMA